MIKRIKEPFLNVVLEFGTAGTALVITVPVINRMNKISGYAAPTQGPAANYITACGSKKGVAIAYDSRHMSPEFAE